MILENAIPCFAVSFQSRTLDNRTLEHQVPIINAFLEEDDIRRMDWSLKSPDLNPIDFVWDGLGGIISQRNPSQDPPGIKDRTVARMGFVATNQALY
ncbi:hypothetical protein TNCV_1612161 [Trichonephila clavipes]|nr:hypothetical protein TNCV_1612161 [Trichonephila clavipes]